MNLFPSPSIQRLAKDNNIVVQTAEMKKKRREDEAKRANANISPLYKAMFGEDDNEKTSNVLVEDDISKLMTDLSPLEVVLGNFIDDILRPLIDISTTLRRQSVQVRLAVIDKSQSRTSRGGSGGHGGHGGHGGSGLSGVINKGVHDTNHKTSRNDRRRRASMTKVTKFDAHSSRILRSTDILEIQNLVGEDTLEEGLVQWSLKDSVFARRKTDADSLDYYDNKKVQNAAFENDWVNLCSKERFTNMINLYDDEGGEEELEEVKKALFECYHTLRDAFEYYSVIGLKSHVVGIYAFNKFVEDCDISDLKTCTNDVIQNIFEFENAEENVSSSNQSKEMNEMNDDSALMRFEFLGAVVRLAVTKFVKTSIVNDVSEAVQMLCNTHISKHLGPQAICDSNDFRKSRLYNPQVDKIYHEHLPKLLGIFKYFGAFDEGTGHLLMNMMEWIAFLKKAHLIADDFEEKEAKFAFAWSQMTVVDEIKRRIPYTCITFEDFLEAIARVCDMKALPTTAELSIAGTKSCGLFFQTLGMYNVILDTSNVMSMCSFSKDCYLYLFKER